jgi:hypothetical protein
MITDHRPSARVRRVHFFTALCASAAVALSGCGGSPSPQVPSQVRVLDVVSLLPPDAEGVIVVDVAAVRSAPFVARVDEALEPYMNEQSTNMRELLNRIDRVAVAFRHEPTDESGEPLLIVMRGSFRASDLQTFAASQTPGTHREHQLRRDGRTVLALASHHTLMFGSDHWVLAALDRLDGLAPPAELSSAVLVDATQRAELGHHTVTYASTVPGDFGLDGVFPVQGNAVSLGAWMDLGEPIRLQGFGLFTDDATAAAMATAMREKIAEGQQSPRAPGRGVRPAVRERQHRGQRTGGGRDLQPPQRDLRAGDHRHAERLPSVHRSQRSRGGRACGGRSDGGPARHRHIHAPLKLSSGWGCGGRRANG